MKPEKKQDIKAEEIIDFLHKHPDFFIQYPEFITKLHITQQFPGNVSSLLEYQANKLRKEIQGLNSSIGLLKKGEIKNRELIKNMNNLVLSTINEKEISNIFEILEKTLGNFYSADIVLLYIFCKSTKNKSGPGLRFLDYNSRIRFMFTEIFHRNKPLCNSLQEEHLNALFGTKGTMINSTILAPLHRKDWCGLLAIGSKEYNCYSHGFELELVDYLSKIITLTLNDLI